MTGKKWGGVPNFFIALCVITALAGVAVMAQA